ncbi:Drug/metabolite transporter [Corchorus olitorius]|uniref:WAT1-related protein n=1 Tax=Corchorus olitorius TaxID=93759 RepID=A0A1R3JB48_9ROSI|nr:Drug/metabolite transporter [Corchorus olitorius]
MEKLAFGTMAGKAKVYGTVIGIGGAMLLTFYKGVQVNLWPKHFDLAHHSGHNNGSNSSNSTSAHTLFGALLAFACCISYTLWFIVQAKMCKKYPCPYSSTALMCIMGAIQSVVYALCLEKDWSQWKLGWNIRLLTVSYAGIVVSGLICTMMCWCVRIKGPLYGSIFNPLMLILVALAESLLLEAKLYLGSILGAVFIVLGLYFVLWGKGNEMKKMKINQTKQVQSTSSQQVETEPIEIIVTSSFDVDISKNNIQINVKNPVKSSPNEDEQQRTRET